MWIEVFHLNTDKLGQINERKQIKIYDIYLTILERGWKMHTIDFQTERLISSEWRRIRDKEKQIWTIFYVLPILDQSDIRFHWKSIDIGNTLSYYSLNLANYAMHYSFIYTHPTIVHSNQLRMLIISEHSSINTIRLEVGLKKNCWNQHSSLAIFDQFKINWLNTD